MIIKDSTGQAYADAAESMQILGIKSRTTLHSIVASENLMPFVKGRSRKIYYLVAVLEEIRDKGEEVRPLYQDTPPAAQTPLNGGTHHATNVPLEDRATQTRIPTVKK